MGHSCHILQAYSCLTAYADRLSAGQNTALAGVPNFTSLLAAGVDMRADEHIFRGICPRSTTCMTKVNMSC